MVVGGGIILGCGHHILFTSIGIIHIFGVIGIIAVPVIDIGTGHVATIRDHRDH
jgi:hypothetical protein